MGSEPWDPSMAAHNLGRGTLGPYFVNIELRSDDVDAMGWCFCFMVASARCWALFTDVFSFCPSGQWSGCNIRGAEIHGVLGHGA